MKKIYNKQNAFTIIELMIVIVIIIIGLSLAYYGFLSQLSHFRLRSGSREVLEMMKLAQASSIRSNQRYRIQLIDLNTYMFQEFSPSLTGFTSSFSGDSGRIGQVVNLPEGIFFSPQGGTSGPCGAAFPCSTPQFNPDGTLSFNAGNDGLGVTDNDEFFRIQWSIGGSIRIQ